MASDGKRLSDDEVRELSAYHAAGIPLPDKYAGVVQDSSQPRGVVYRYATAAEIKDAESGAKAAAIAAEEDAALMERVRAEAAKRGAYVPPAPPPEPTPATAAERRG